MVVVVVEEGSRGARIFFDLDLLPNSDVKANNKKKSR